EGEYRPGRNLRGRLLACLAVRGPVQPHRFQPRQGNRHAGAAQEGSPVHCPLSTEIIHPTVLSLVGGCHRVWNARVATSACTIDCRRYSSLPELARIPFTSSRSAAPTGRPSA